jgi:hypothetical protein
VAEGWPAILSSLKSYFDTGTALEVNAAQDFLPLYRRLTPRPKSRFCAARQSARRCRSGAFQARDNPETALQRSKPQLVGYGL